MCKNNSDMEQKLSRDDFIAYIGGSDFHDATIVSRRLRGTHLEVFLKDVNERPFQVHFSGVEGVKENQPEGMLLYALAELKGNSALRRFCFVNWNEKDSAELEVVATDCRVLQGE